MKCITQQTSNPVKLICRLLLLLDSNGVVDVKSEKNAPLGAYLFALKYIEMNLLDLFHLSYSFPFFL